MEDKEEAGPSEDIEVEAELPSEKNADLIMGVCDHSLAFQDTSLEEVD